MLSAVWSVLINHNNGSESPLESDKALPQIRVSSRFLPRFVINSRSSAPYTTPPYKYHSASFCWLLNKTAELLQMFACRVEFSCVCDMSILGSLGLEHDAGGGGCAVIFTSCALESDYDEAEVEEWEESHFLVYSLELCCFSCCCCCFCSRLRLLGSLGIS